MAKKTFPRELPLLPLRDMVVFPHMVLPIYVGRPKSVAALEAGLAQDKRVLLVTQRDPTTSDPGAKELYGVGCVATVLQVLRLPDGTVKALCEGETRVRFAIVPQDDDAACMKAVAQELSDGAPTLEDGERSEALRRSVADSFSRYVKLQPKIADVVADTVTKIADNGQFADAVCAQLQSKIDVRQKLLETQGLAQRLDAVLHVLEQEIDILKVEERIRGRVKRAMDKSQRDYYLREQVKAIQTELGEDEEANETEELGKKIEESGMSAEALEKARSELRKLRMMAPMSAEATVVRNYIETLVDVPWKAKSRISHDIRKAERILNDDHWGLDKVKERILEYLAVQQRVSKVKSPILCLVGGPGVGKTSLGQSIARATGRKFVRMALGGVHDEAEIRGHRRTYIGSMPGKIIQSVTKSGVRNPLFLLDEVDKLGSDFRGDPAAALLEVLDPEQNSHFEDHYLEVEYDLSDVMFVATSNSMNIPAPLLDRMEVINLSGYTEDEKLNIAKRHLLPKQLKLNGVRAGELEVTEDALRAIIRYYTREAGVRGLEREISRICRKVVRSLLEEGTAAKPVAVTGENIGKYLGVRKFTFGLANREDRVGQVMGLAWTEVGGELLPVEVAVFPGKGAVQRTGSLGDVMKESVEAARSVVRSRAASLGIEDEAFAKTDIHIHFPEGAIPKDGPSAGAAITTSIVSAMTGIAVRRDVAMTGEITLRGEVLEIGGLKEKLLAALRGGIRTVMIPEDNVKDLAEIPDNVKNGLEIIPVRWIDRVLEVALTRAPQPRPDVIAPKPVAADAPKRPVAN